MVKPHGIVSRSRPAAQSPSGIQTRRVMIALIPPAIALVAVLGFRASGLVAAALTCAAAVLLFVTDQASLAATATVILAGGERALRDAALLTLVVAAMVLPGILFVEMTGRLGAPQAIARLLSALRLSPPQTAMLVATGFGVLVESLTGMGVSLLVTVPLLLTLVPRREAIGLALVSMSLMPWGALAISGIVGAQLAALPVAVLAHAASLISGPVAFLLPALCLVFVPGAKVNDLPVAIGAGAILCLAIICASATLGIEVAGVAGGFAVILFLASLAKREGLATALTDPALRPYAALILLVVVQKSVIVILGTGGFAPSIDTGRVAFPLLSSPGIALFAAALLTSPRTLTPEVLQCVVARAWRPLLTVALFMLAARLMVEAGAVDALAKSVASLGPEVAIMSTALLGALAGFATGSGVTGNALFMPSAAATGRALGDAALFAAVQNSAAGHAAMASLPVAAILLAALPNRKAGDDRTILSLGLRLTAAHVAVVVLAALFWSAVS